MTSKIVANLLKKIGQPDLVDILARELSGTELNSVLLEVCNHRAASLTAPQLLDQYVNNRLVKPSDIPVLTARKAELQVLELLTRFGFEPIDLSPVTAFGSCSVVAPASQMKILSALRGTEVLADSTNAIALHASHLKRQGRAHDDRELVMKYSSISRLLRTQSIRGKGFTPHFRVGCLATCGKDTGDFGFEKTSLLEHMRAMSTLFLDHCKAESVSFRLLARPGYAHGEALINKLEEFIHSSDPGLRFCVVPQAGKQNTYYHGVQYKTDIVVKGITYEIADGGFVDWTQQLLQNKKERMFCTGFGFDLMLRIVAGEL